MSDPRTPEQIKAQDDLQSAIEGHVQAYRGSGNGDIEVTGDWILVAAVSCLDIEGGERNYAYQMAFSGGEMPEHVAYGLLHQANLLLERAERE